MNHRPKIHKPRSQHMGAHISAWHSSQQIQHNKNTSAQDSHERTAQYCYKGQTKFTATEQINQHHIFTKERGREARKKLSTWQGTAAVPSIIQP
jgi:hypothetical protein